MATSRHADGCPPTRVEPISRVLALRAPSIWNTQPWHWRVEHDVAQLRADRRRQVHSIDPDGRLLTVSTAAARADVGRPRGTPAFWPKDCTGSRRPCACPVRRPASAVGGRA
jgi:hypothetical protein